jgi:predicted house-cleaning noncanonical NTP pyrophosphatase (MazG superfamily)
LALFKNGPGDLSPRLYQEVIHLPTYNKLVRDKIPQIIEQSGKKFSARTLNDQEYIKYLQQKSYEELDERSAEGLKKESS